jgi:hypothetical protein
METSHSQSIPMDEVDLNMRGLDVRDVVNLSAAEQAEVRHGKLVVSACNADIESRKCARDDIFDAMIDGGANINLGPRRLVKALGLEIVPHVDARRIGTADATGHMVIAGWIFPRGFTGPIAIVERAAYTLLSVSELQKNGMGVNCPPSRSVCELVTTDAERQERVFISLAQSPPTNLYFVDIRKLMDKYMPEYVPAPGEKGRGVFGACNGIVEKQREPSGEQHSPQHRRLGGGRGVSHRMRPVEQVSLQQSTVEKRLMLNPECGPCTAI